VCERLMVVIMATLLGMIGGGVLLYVLIMTLEMRRLDRDLYRDGYEHGFRLWQNSNLTVDYLRKLHAGLNPKSPHARGTLAGVNDYLDILEGKGK
jgi:hypothetical protein